MLLRACPWTLCHISAGVSSSSEVERYTRAVCPLLCLFWAGLGISCTLGLQPKTGLISTANENGFSVQQPISHLLCLPLQLLHGLSTEVSQQVVCGSEVLLGLLCVQPLLRAQGYGPGTCPAGMLQGGWILLCSPPQSYVMVSSGPS